MEPRRPTPALLPLVLAALAVLVGVAALPGASFAQGESAEPADLPRPCEADPLHRQLDFWIGEWTVLDGEGRELGTSRIRSRDGGCVIEEEWTSARGGGSGLGVNFVDGEDGRWRQVWIGSTGTVVRYEGEREGDAVRFQGRTTMADGTLSLSRAVLEPTGDGSLRQRIERSTDGGTTWTVYFEGTYVPAGAPRPMPMPTPTPRPDPAPAPAPEAPGEEGAPSQVTAVSVEVPEEDIPVEDRPKRHLRSPMMLEVPVGAVESIPEGYSWSTDQTAQYVVEEAVVRRVSMSRQERRRGVELTVTTTMHSTRFLNHGDLQVELVSGGQVIASGRVDDFAIGRSLPAQGDGPGLEKRVVLTLDRETFDAAFGGEERPVLRVTLAIRD
jgi:hypothetical protein